MGLVGRWVRGRAPGRHLTLKGPPAPRPETDLRAQIDLLGCVTAAVTAAPQPGSPCLLLSVPFRAASGHMSQVSLEENVVGERALVSQSPDLCEGLLADLQGRTPNSEKAGGSPVTRQKHNPGCPGVCVMCLQLLTETWWSHFFCLLISFCSTPGPD